MDRALWVRLVSGPKARRGSRFFILPMNHFVHVQFEFAVVMVERVLFPALADASVVDARRHSAHHKFVIGPHS